MRRFPFDRAAVLKAAMEPLSESKWKDFLGCCWGKHARDKPFPRNPPKNTPKRNLNQSVLKRAPFCGQLRNRCQKASQKSFLGAFGRNMPEQAFPENLPRNTSKRNLNQSVSAWWNASRHARQSHCIRKQVKKAPCAIWAKHAREKPFPRNPPSNMPKRNLNQSVLKPGAAYLHGTGVRKQVKGVP